MSYFEIKQARKPESPPPHFEDRRMWIVKTKFQTYACKNKPQFIKDWVYLIGRDGREYYIPANRIDLSGRKLIITERIYKLGPKGGKNENT